MDPCEKCSYMKPCATHCEYMKALLELRKLRKYREYMTQKAYDGATDFEKIFDEAEQFIREE